MHFDDGALFRSHFERRILQIPRIPVLLKHLNGKMLSRLVVSYKALGNTFFFVDVKEIPNEKLQRSFLVL